MVSLFLAILQVCSSKPSRFYFFHIIICTLFVGLLRGLLVCLVWLSFGPIFVGCWLVWFLGLRDSAETRDVTWTVGSPQDTLAAVGPTQTRG